MTIISLKEFLLTGRFGSVSIGASQQEVIEYLGKPKEIADFGEGSIGFFYNGFEFYFWANSEKSYAIQMESIDVLLDSKSKLYPLNKDSKIDISVLLLLENLHYDTLARYFSQENIAFEKLEKTTHDELVLKSGVRLDFEDWDEKSAKNNTKLNGIRFFNYE